jgi:hypothetical protein
MQKRQVPGKLQATNRLSCDQLIKELMKKQENLPRRNSQAGLALIQSAGPRSLLTNCGDSINMPRIMSQYNKTDVKRTFANTSSLENQEKPVVS